jgi:hypothetical protein
LSQYLVDAKKNDHDLIVSLQTLPSLRRTDLVFWHNHIFLSFDLPVLRCVPSYGERAFSVAAPKLWNKLPMGLMTCTNLLSFNSLLKTHLFRAAFSGED